MALKTEEAINTIEKEILNRLQTAGFLVEASAKKKCPVDTGNLRASIHTSLEEEEKAVYIGTNVEYAACVENGTSKMKAQPYLAPALQENQQQIINMFEGLI